MREIPFDRTGTRRLEIDEPWFAIDEQDVVWMRRAVNHHVGLGERLDVQTLEKMIEHPDQ